MELENFQDIKGFPNYMINEYGDVYSKKLNRLLKIRKNNYGYNTFSLRNNKKTYTKSQHRLLGIQYLPNPDNLPCIDHINRNKLDNCLSNLRWVSYSLNSKNKSSKLNATSRFIGVRKTINKKKPYRAETTYQGKYYSIGYYTTEEEAFEAYKQFNLEKFDIQIS